MRLHQAMLFVKDFPGMTEFYANTLGLKPIPESRTETWIEFETGLALHAIPPHIADQIEIKSPPGPREETPFKLIFEVDDLTMELKRLEALGVTLVHRPWGTVDAMDPEGNIFGIKSA